MTDNSMFILAVVILLVFSAMFSAIETAFSCASRIRLKNMTSDGDRRAGSVLRILENYDRFLTTVLIGNNIVNITAATVSTILFSRMFGETNGPSISTVVLTIATLMFGEIAPKSIAKQCPEKFSCATVGIMKFFLVLLRPFSWLLSGWTFVVNHVVNVQEDESDISDELITMVDEAEREGDLEEHQSDLISNAISFNDLDVKDVLTPRVDVVAVDMTTPIDEIERVFRENSFSRLPVYENSIDNIVGVIHEKDFYELRYHQRGPIRKIIKQVIYTSPNTAISVVMKQLQASKLHMAVVLDEYGGTDGIITLEDIIE